MYSKYLLHARQCSRYWRKQERHNVCPQRAYILEKETEADVQPKIHYEDNVNFSKVYEKGKIDP